MIEMPSSDPTLDDFFEDFYADHPVHSSFIGRHEHDGRWPDVSESEVASRLSRYASMLPSLETDGASGARTRDRRLAAGFVRLRSWELRSGHMHRRNPAWYTGEALFGLLSLFLSDFAPLPDRAERAGERLGGLADWLRSARENVEGAPAAWIERALRECASLRAFLTEGVLRLDEDAAVPLPSSVATTLRAASGDALREVDRHEAHLRASLSGALPAVPVSGREAFVLHLREAHALQDSPESLVESAEAEIARVQAQLGERARALGADTPAEVLQRLRALHPSRAGYLDAYRGEWARHRAFAEERDLLSWPDFPIEYVERPPWARAAAPGSYFLFYRAPAAFDRPAVHRYMVSPLDESASDEDLSDFLAAHNDSVIRLNHVIHHGGVGHHVQNWHAYRAESRVGRIAAVDCASRIAMHCGATMAEGWACYATDLMAEQGYLTPMEEFAEFQGRIRMAARTVVDVQLHTGRFTFDEAVDYYRGVAGMPEAAARGEATKNSMFPAAALIYRVGSQAIHEARHFFVDGLGWSLRRFHDEFLSYGSIPVSMIVEAMKENADVAAE